MVVSVDLAGLEETVRTVVREEIQAAMELRGERESPWLDVGGAAERACMTEEAIRAATRRGQLRVHRSETGRLRYRVEDVDIFLKGEI